MTQWQEYNTNPFVADHPGTPLFNLKFIHYPHVFLQIPLNFVSDGVDCTITINVLFSNFFLHGIVVKGSFIYGAIHRLLDGGQDSMIGPL